MSSDYLPDVADFLFNYARCLHDQDEDEKAKAQYRKLDSHLYKYVGCQTCEDNEKRIYILSPTERCRTTNKVTSMSRSEMFM